VEISPKFEDENLPEKFSTEMDFSNVDPWTYTSYEPRTELQGPMLWFLNIFAKNGEKLAFLTQNKAKSCKNLII
jgi:hypothetical protein